MLASPALRSLAKLKKGLLMRHFFSYGPIDAELHYFAPRKNLIDRAYTLLRGEKPDKGGHYITVWAPRQAGKTWIMQRVVEMLKKTGDFEVAIITMEFAKEVGDATIKQEMAVERRTEENGSQDF